MMKNLKAVVFFLLATIFASSLWAKSDYIYNSKANWVKLVDVKSRGLSSTFKHPAKDIKPEQIEAMLLSIKISKNNLLKKDVDSVEVFSSWEARFFAPYISQALAQAAPNQLVNFSLIHKRPLFVLQNDRLSMIDIWVSDQGIHFNFTKLFAKMEGDYLASSNMDKAMRNAKTRRIFLEAGPGQKLSYSGPTEIILDPAYDFNAQVNENLAKEKEEEERALKPQNHSSVTPAPAAKPTPTSKESSPAYQPSDNLSAAAERLQELKDLREQKLITESEYQELRKKFLNGL